MKEFKIFIGVIFCLIFVVWCATELYRYITFNIDVTDRLKRAADANTIELAIQEMDYVISFIEKKDLTDGYTSVIYKTPDEDVGFWYNNLKASLLELKKVEPATTQLEKSNILMKLRETLVDHEKDGVNVTMPTGISLFPYNVIFGIWGIINIILLIVAIILFTSAYNEW
jgi:hypothetical protein